MRSNFFANAKLSSKIKIIDRIMALLFALFWGTIAVILACNFIEKKYIYPLDYSDVVFEYADEYELDRALVFSIIKVESNFDKNAVSSAGAIGLMQITPRTAEYIAKLIGQKEYDLFDKITNVNFGCFYLNYLFKRFSSLDLVVCAYNAGEGNVDSWLKNKEYSNDGKRLNKIPFKETEEYKTKIDKSYKKYSQLYQNILDKRENFE